MNQDSASAKKLKKAGLVLLFVLPALFFYGTFNLLGIARTFYYSTMDWKGISANKVFLGLSNYIAVAKDMNFWNALKNNMILVIASMFIQMPGALLLALLINSKLRFTKFFRTVFFMPMLLSTVATGIMWILFYDPNFGLMAKVIRALGLKMSTAFLQGSTAMPAILFVICWQFIPYYMIIFKAGLSNVPEELYEAAKIDGCGTMQIFFYIIAPMSKPSLIVSALLNFIWAWKDVWYSNIYLGKPERQTISVRLLSLIGDKSVEYGQMMAATVMMMLPVILLYFCAQKYFDEGITITELK